jgi:serine/threonine-protein kinase
MGEVYHAHDPRLGREVAIKVLPEATAGDAERLHRLEREARAASALNHPNIVTIYDIGEDDGTLYVAMEYIEGRTLREALGQGALPVREVLHLAGQIAEGLAKAHAAGIIHRDLKPENVMITGDGLVKILDFGLAKLQVQDPGAASDVVTATRTTRIGAIVGTALYMSPEQAAGRPLDYRSDQFSFGSILYEMATGTLAFKRDSLPQIQAAIIEDQPAPMDRATVPSRLSAIVSRCLAKDREERYDSTRELAKNLKSVLEAPAASGREPPQPPQRRFGWRRTSGVVARAGVVAARLAVAVGLNLGSVRDRLARSFGSTPIRSLAVLPLQNLSGDPEQEYFADGMTGALIADLARIRALRVISRQSVMHYKGSEKTLPEIARELGVDVVLEGSVVRSGSHVRVTTQLVEAATDRHLWVDSFDRELRDILTLYGDVARAIAVEIEANLSPEEEASLSRVRPVDSESYDLYLMGRHHSSKLTPPSLVQGIDYFQKAIETDPTNALAHAGLANAYAYQGLFGHNSPELVMPLAQAAAIKALEIDDALSDTHVVLGHIDWAFRWEWENAAREFLRAIDLEPSNAYAHSMHGMYLTSLGRFEEGALKIERALDLDPLSLGPNDALMWTLYFSRRFDKVPQQCQKLLELDPTSFMGHWVQSFAYRQRGMDREASLTLQEGFALAGFADVAEAFERGRNASGETGAMREGAVALVARSKAHYISSVMVAVLFVSAEEREDALAWLERAADERAGLLVWIKVAPYWDPLRGDPRFEAVVRRLGFPG